MGMGVGGFTSNKDNVLVSICQPSISITIGYESVGKTAVPFIGSLDPQYQGER